MTSTCIGIAVSVQIKRFLYDSGVEMQMKKYEQGPAQTGHMCWQAGGGDRHHESSCHPGLPHSYDPLLFWLSLGGFWVMSTDMTKPVELPHFHALARLVLWRAGNICGQSPSSPFRSGELPLLTVCHMTPCFLFHE